MGWERRGDSRGSWGALAANGQGGDAAAGGQKGPVGRGKNQIRPAERGEEGEAHMQLAVPL